MSVSAEALLALASRVLDARPDVPAERALAELGGIRGEVERIAARAGPSAAADVRRALAAAGLGALAPEGAPLSVVRAALERLEAQATALAIARAPRAPRGEPDSR